MRRLTSPGLLGGLLHWLPWSFPSTPVAVGRERLDAPDKRVGADIDQVVTAFPPDGHRLASKYCTFPHHCPRRSPPLPWAGRDGTMGQEPIVRKGRGPPSKRVVR